MRAPVRRSDVRPRSEALPEELGASGGAARASPETKQQKEVTLQREEVPESDLHPRTSPTPLSVRDINPTLGCEGSRDQVRDSCVVQVVAIPLSWEDDVDDHDFVVYEREEPAGGSGGAGGTGGQATEAFLAETPSGGAGGEGGGSPSHPGEAEGRQEAAGGHGGKL